MKGLLKNSFWRVLELFYENKNTPVHLREISRKIKLNESTTFVHLNNLVKIGILRTNKDGNLKKFYVKKAQIPYLFPMFDHEKLESLPLLRRDAIKLYLQKLESKPLLLVVFGSTAKGIFRKDSDIDLLEIRVKEDKKTPEKYVEAQTGIKLQVFKISERDFYMELKLKKDNVIQSALETGFPVFNLEYFYEIIYE